MQILFPSCHYTTKVYMVNAMVFPVVMYGWDSMDMSLSTLQELVMEKSCVLQYMGSQRVARDWVTELNWT